MKSAGKGKKAGKSRGPLKKGSAEYKRTLNELTNISFASGDDKMKHVAIAGKCRTPEECRNAIVGKDHLKQGGGFGDLDDTAIVQLGLGGASLYDQVDPKWIAAGFDRVLV